MIGGNLSTISINTYSNDVRVSISRTRFLFFACLLRVLIGSLNCVSRYVISQSDYFGFGSGR